MAGGERYLRALGERFLAEDRRDWPRQFYAAAQALEAIGEIDPSAMGDIHYEIEASFARRDRKPEPHRPNRSDRRRPFPLGAANLETPQLTVRAALARLPSPYGDGATNFITTEGDQTFLVGSGAGPAPWPDETPPPRLTQFSGSGVPSGSFVSAQLIEARRATPELPVPPFRAVTDDRGTHYQLRRDSWSTPDRSSPRPRWELRALIKPTPDPAVRWLDFETDQGSIRAALEWPVTTGVDRQPLEPPPTLAESYLRYQIHHQAWLHLLDRQRRLDRLDTVVEALVAVGAISPQDQTVRAVTAVDEAIVGAPPTDELPPLIASALTANGPTSWRGVAAIGVTIENLDGVTVALEALVGHQDRVALHFYSPRSDDDSILGGVFAHKLVVYATDDHGRGYVTSTEPLSGTEHGAYHFRPALSVDAQEFTVSFEGPATRATARIGLTPN